MLNVKVYPEPANGLSPSDYFWLLSESSHRRKLPGGGIYVKQYLALALDSQACDKERLDLDPRSVHLKQHFTKALRCSGLRALLLSYFPQIL